MWSLRINHDMCLHLSPFSFPSFLFFFHPSTLKNNNNQSLFGGLLLGGLCSAFLRCVQVLSGCREWGLLLCAQASHGGGLSHGALVLGTQASIVEAHGLWWLWRPDFSCSTACRIFLEQGSHHVSCIGRWVLIHCTTVEAPSFYI